jgi:chemotaxis protein CheC
MPFVKRGTAAASPLADELEAHTMTEAEPFAPLSELERDAIAELANVAMGRAATSLRQMVESEIMLSVPKVEILDVQAAAESLAKPRGAHFVAVRQDFSGAISGRALLIFPETSSLELVREVLGRQMPAQYIIDMEEDALAETGNIIINSWVGTIANLLGQNLHVSLPVVVRRERPHVFESASPSEAMVLFLHIKFEISMRDVHGYIAVVMDVPSVNTLRMLVDKYVNQHIGKIAPSGRS